MRRSFIIWAIILWVPLGALPGLAQQDKLEGNWEGKVRAPQGEISAAATFKKEGEGYTGTITGMRGQSIPLKEVKLDGEKVTAKAEVEAQGNTIVINYSFTLQGDMLKGTGALDFGGQAFTFDLELKRAAAGASAQSAAGAPAPPGQEQTSGQAQPRAQRPEVPQPQQKQSIDYFAGQWSFKYIGRESPLGPAPREGVVTFTKRPDGKSVEGVAQGKHEGGAFKETSVITFDEATKMLTVSERTAGGVQINSKGDWTSPIAIRFTVEPIKVKGQTLQLRRMISVVAAHSFTVTEELSEDGGPFVRLGNGLFTRVSPTATKN